MCFKVGLVGKILMRSGATKVLLGRLRKIWSLGEEN